MRKLIHLRKFASEKSPSLRSFFVSSPVSFLNAFTVKSFKNETGLDTKKDLKLGDFSDANFRKWINFRIQALTDFVADIAKNAKSVNPEIKVIPEIYPGIEEEAVRVGADVYQMYEVVDA